jgi:esterase
MSQPILYSKIEGNGFPFLILHGFLGMSDNWKTLGVQFADAGFEVHMLDLRNHGRSFHDDNFTYEAMTQDILNYCETHQLKKIHLLGHSMGGKVAMNFAASYPEKVEKLIIADIGPKYYPPHHQDILEGLSAVDFSKKPERNEVDDILKQYISIFSVRQFLMKSLYWKESGQLDFRFNVPVFVKSFEEIGKELPSDLVFNQPTLFIKGGASNYILDDDLIDIKKQFPEAVFETIPKVGHWLHAENPTLFHEHTLNFLKQS